MQETHQLDRLPLGTPPLDLRLLLDRCEEHYWRNAARFEAVAARLEVEQARWEALAKEALERRRTLRREIAELRRQTQAIRRQLRGDQTDE